MTPSDHIPPDSRSFFDVVWGLEASRANQASVGTADSVSEESVRFHASTSLGYPTREVERTWWAKDKQGRDRFHMRISFFGLTGITSPLPPAYLREILDDLDTSGEPRVADFLDIFNHRIISLYFRAWMKYRGHMISDATRRGGIGQMLMALGGLDGSLPRDPDVDLDPQTLLPYVGPLTRRVKSATTTESCLSALLGGMPVTVLPYSLREVPVPEEQKMRLGLSACELDSQSPPALGEYVPDFMGRCEVRMGPMSRAQFDALEPAGKTWKAVQQMLSKTLPSTLEYKLVLLLDEQAIEPWTLETEDRARLGRNMWLGTPGLSDRELPCSIRDTFSLHPRSRQVAGSVHS